MIITLLTISFFSLGPLVGKVKDYQVEVIVDTLCNNMVGDKEQLRDISSIGLKTVINELPLTTQTLAATGKLRFSYMLKCLLYETSYPKNISAYFLILLMDKICIL